MPFPLLFLFPSGYSFMAENSSCYIDWTFSSESLSYSPPPMSRRLTQKVRGKMVSSSARLASAQRVDTQEVTSQEGQPAPPPSGSVPPRESTFSSRDDIGSVLLSSTIVSLLQKKFFLVGFEAIDPLLIDRAHHPPPGCLTVYAAQLSSGYKFPLYPLLVQVLNVLTVFS